MIRLKSSIYYSEIISHFRLLTVNKKSFLEYLSSPYRIILISIFTILFFPHVFVVVKDINFVASYEVDPGSMIRSILSLFQNSYNMNVAYHSRYYGWTYFSINYFLLMPIYLAKVLKIATDDYYLFVGIRFIFFMIGLSSVLAFFEVAKRTLKQNFLSFLAAILYVASPVVFYFFYFIHPETTGLLFLFISILCLIRYNEGWAEDHRWYTFGLLSLVLSVLSKQVFFFTAPPVIFLYMYFYCHHRKKSIFRFLISKQFIKVLFASIVFSILIFFTINPFAFFQPKVFITNQIAIFSDQTQSTLTRTETIDAWIKIIKTIPIIFISIISFPFTILGAVIFGLFGKQRETPPNIRQTGSLPYAVPPGMLVITGIPKEPIFGRDQKTGKVFYVVNILSAVLFIIIYSISAQLVIGKTYFAPIYPFFVLNLISIPLYIVRKWNVNIIKLLVMIPLTYFLFFVLVDNFSISIPDGYTRLMYQNTDIYKVFNYIEENVPNGSKILYDHFVAIPSDKGIIGCQYWQGCIDYMEKLQPDYVIFNENFTFNGMHLPTEQLKKYVKDSHYILIDTIGVVGVWKRPGN